MVIVMMIAVAVAFARRPRTSREDVSLKTIKSKRLFKHSLTIIKLAHSFILLVLLVLIVCSHTPPFTSTNVPRLRKPTRVAVLAN